MLWTNPVCRLSQLVITNPYSVLQTSPAVADGVQDDDPHAAMAALESSFPDLKRNKHKKKGGQAALPGLVEAGKLCTLLCSTHKELWICNNELSSACAKISALHPCQHLQPDNIVLYTTLLSTTAMYSDSLQSCRSLMLCNDFHVHLTCYACTACIAGLASAIPAAVDPSEPVYCYCQRVSFGEMIACDNEDCAIEWFHFECVGLTPENRPKGKWYCKECTQLRKAAR